MGRRAKNIDHIILVRLVTMADVAMMVPVVESLRQARPGLKITLLIKPPYKPFFRTVPDLGFIDYEPAGRHGGIIGFFRLAGDIVRSGAQAMADLQDTLYTRLLKMRLFFTGMRFSTIDKGKHERRGLTRRSQKVLAPIMPMVERYAETIYRLGVYFPMTASSGQRTVYPMPRGLVVGSKKGVWVGVAPFAKHKGKIYPIPLTDQLIDILRQKYNKVFLFGGGVYERSFAEGMEQRHQDVVSVVGRLDLSEEMDVMSNMDAMITMDSATMQIASLVGTPVISVWGATHPFLGFYGWGQDPGDTVQLPLPCRPCSVYGKKPCIFGDYRCLADIPPRQIADALERRINSSSTREGPTRKRKPRAGSELRAAAAPKRRRGRDEEKE